MPNLLYTIGIPRSGKSTICTKWASEKPMRAIVNSDSIRLALTGKRYEPLAETMVFATKHIMIRALLERGFDVIVDGTHSTEISIQRILEIDINAKAIPVCCDVDEAKARAKATNQLDLYDSIVRIHKNMLNLGLYDSSRDYIFVDGIKTYSTWQFDNIKNIIKKDIIQRNLYGKFGDKNG